MEESHDDCLQPLGFRGSLPLNAGCKEMAAGYRYLVVLCIARGELVSHYEPLEAALDGPLA